jgi:Uma2 family endonuclease
MGAKTAISIAQYLETSFPDFDREYVDGELVERALPDDPHSTTQALLIHFFMALRNTLKLYVRPELRLRVRQERVRIPDVAVFHPNRPPREIHSVPPFIAIEILSPDDRMSEVQTKLDEYRTWGVPHVWLVDPHTERMYSCDNGFAQVPTLRVPELGLELKPDDIFERE